MKKFIKPAVFLPILVGMIIGVVLFLWGDAQDAPGICLAGIAIAFVLCMWGIRNAGVLKSNFFAPILLLSFGVGGIILTLVLLFDGEFGTVPGIAAVGIILSMALLAIGGRGLKKATSISSPPNT